MEELKRLYEKLQTLDDDEQRNELWKIIIEKNKILLHDNLEKLDAIMKDKVGALKNLGKILEDKLKELSELRDRKRNKKME
ncbi:MAG: hypothetical protein ACFFAN_10880 [Promethearchaeota archaeon]